MRPIRPWFVAIPIASGLVASGCVGGGVFYEQHLTGKYALWAVDGLAGNSLVEESPNGGGAKVIIGPTVFSAGFNDQFIIVARHPERGPLTFDRATTEYFIVTTVDSRVHGPADKASFPALRSELRVPAELQFSVTLQQLVRGQSANRRVNLTVRASRRLQTDASGAPPRPAGYAQR